jgi:hypothetical protein
MSPPHPRIEAVDAALAAVLRAKSGTERLRLAHEAWELARDRLMAFLRARHPEWSEDVLRKQVARRLSDEPG